MEKPPVIVLDACVLYPAAQRDLFMWLAAVGLVCETPDAFLCRLLEKSPEEVGSAFFRMRYNLRNPAKTSRECFETLAAQGLKAFARMIGESIVKRRA
jgi:hypothetical protein